MTLAGTSQSAVPGAFWALGAEQLFRQTQSGPQGLSGQQAEQHLARYGHNRTSELRSLGLVARLLKRLLEPLIAILLIAALISGINGDFTSFAIILVIVGMSILLDVLQEHHAERAAEMLRHSVAIHADVLRDGKPVDLPADCVVPGDVIDLRAGDLVPADGLILASSNAYANETLVTGEPYPVHKRAEACDAQSPAEAFNALFAGTSIISGEVRMLAVATGANTRFGGIAAALTLAEEPSALERGTHRLGQLILRLTAFLVLMVLLVHVALGRPALDSFMFAVALAVGLTPELLPMIMTVTLSRGALRMAGKQVIVKRLSAIHDLGAMDVFCSDKTGTLTEAHISLVAALGNDGEESSRVLELAAINSHFASGIHSPLDAAILERAREMDMLAWQKSGEIPFDFERRRIAIAARKGRRQILAVKGAPESVIPLASRILLTTGKIAPLSAQRRGALMKLHDQNAEKGYRLLAVAWKPLADSSQRASLRDESGLIMAGFCVFDDPPKPGAAAAIQRLARAGIRIKILSGDNGAVVSHLAQELNIPATGLVTGKEIEALGDQALAVRVEEVDLFARVLPDQKTRIIRALQARGHVVGFIGDGVNDAPAIHTAEVGLSVESATDVARAAADMIMLERDLGVLADGVAEGRRTLVNILKYVRMGTSSNFGNMLSMALASAALPFLPLLAPQILLNNFLYDLSEIGIPFDTVDDEDVAVPHSWDMAQILRYTIAMGLLSTVFDIITFVVLIRWFASTPETFRTAWFVESMATQIMVIFVIRTWRRAWQSPISGVLAATSAGALLAAITIANSPLGQAFDFKPLPAALGAAMACIVVIYLMLAEGVKSAAERWLR